MNRYTYMENGHWRVKIGEEEIRAGFVERLAEYENLDLSPDEIKQQLEEYRAYRHVCGGRSPEEIELAIRTTEEFKKTVAQIKQEFNRQLSGLLPKELLFPEGDVTVGNGDSK